MAETKIPVSALSLISQAVVCVRRDCVVYMNPAAISLAGGDLTGKPASLLFPQHILDLKSSGFAATAFIGKKNCALTCTVSSGERIFALTPEGEVEQTEAAIFASMRTSLANVKLCGSRISRLAEMRDDPSLRSYAAALNRSYYKMKRNVDNLSLNELIRRGEYPFFAESVNLAELFSKLIDTVNILLGTTPKIEFSAPEELHVVVDSYLAELALLNLISNSLAHCGKNDRISVSLLRTDKNVVLSVDDSGSGIAPEDLPYIFDRRHRELELTAAAEGVGLGLATVRSIARLHDGALIVESRGIGRGTSVRLMFSGFVTPSRSLKSESSIYENSELLSILQELVASLPDDCYLAAVDD